MRRLRRMSSTAFSMGLLFPLILCLVSPKALGQTAIAFREGTQPERIYFFFPSFDDGHLHVNYWDGTQWNWADQGTPPGTKVQGGPAVITYRDGAGKQRIYVFVTGSDGHLHVNYWDGTHWKWADQGMPPGTSVGEGWGGAAAVTYLDATGKQRIYVFVEGDNKRIYLNYWDGAQWNWADQGTPSGITKVYLGVGVTTFLDNSGKQWIYAFLHGWDNGHLYVNSWDGTKWLWADHGTPPGTGVNWPWGLMGGGAVTTYRDGAGKQRIYAFTGGNDGHLYTNYWNGTEWEWADQGMPQGASGLITYGGVITYPEGTGKQRIYAFSLDNVLYPHFYVNYWDGDQWKWADQGFCPGEQAVVGGWEGGLTTYRDAAGKQHIYLFVFCEGPNEPKLYLNLWNGTQWSWADHGLLPSGTPTTGPSPPTCGEKCSIAEGHCMGRAHSVSDRQGCIADKGECMAECK